MSLGAVDASALLCLQLNESHAAEVEFRLRQYDHLVIGSPSLVEARIALTRRIGESARLEIEGIVRAFGIRTVAFSPDHAEVAHTAYLRYGKGRHPAALNYGDCMAYAVAKVARAELIYVGDDFAQTDLA